MKNFICTLLFVLPIFTGLCQSKKTSEQKQIIPSKVYSWRVPDQKFRKDISEVKLFEGSGFDMEYVGMHAFAIVTSKRKTDFQVPSNEEHLLLVKSGTLNISFKDSIRSLGKGSIALLMPEEKYSLVNRQEPLCEYYLMKYRSKSPVNPSRGQSSGGSFVKDWNTLVFRPNERGGTRKYFEKETAMSKRFEMHVTTLNEGLKSHDAHTHRAEEIILIIDNNTEMQIGDQFFKGKAGDVYYLGSNILHGIRNDGTGPCTYFAYQFE